MHAEVPGLWRVETVHDEKMAQTLNQMWGKRKGAGQPLGVLMQVSTSKEDSKWVGLKGRLLKA